MALPLQYLIKLQLQDFQVNLLKAYSPVGYTIF